MFDWLTWSELSALGGVIFIDLVLAGDNAVVVGMAAAGLPADQRKKAILIGILAATLMRIGFALVTTQLLQIVGLMLVGGLLLIWVSWKLWRELRTPHTEEAHAVAAVDEAVDEVMGQPRPARLDAPRQPRKTFRQAIIQIVVADISMSLDNVLAVAGTARDHTWVLILGLTLSVALMGVAANLVAQLLQRHRWIAYIGLGVILVVAVKMIWDGWMEVEPIVAAAAGIG